MEVKAEIYDKDESKIHIEMPSLYKDLIRTLPGSKFDSKNSIWLVNKTWQTYIALFNTFKSELKIGPKMSQWISSVYTEKIAPSLELRNTVSATGYPDLYPHQNGGVRFLTVAERAILADGLGSGKTRTAFSAVKRLSETGNVVFPVLIVAPNSTKISWKREIEEVWSGLTISIVGGTAVQRRKALLKPAHVYIMNWESLKGHSRLAPYGSIALKRCKECGGVDETVKPASCHAHPKELNMMHFNTVIADEVHRAKTPDSQQTRALKAATGDAKYRFALTGTPIANAPDDLWSILNWLYPESFPSRTKFVDRYLDVTKNVFGAETVTGIKKHMEGEFFSILDPVLRRMPKEIVLPFLPPVVYERRDVEMSAKQRKAYEQMRDKMVAELDSGILVTTSPLTKMTRLLQFASSYAEVETKSIIDPNGEEKFVSEVTLSEPSNKLDAFMDDIEGFAGESVVVFSPSKQMINMLASRLDKIHIRYGRITGEENSMERQIHMDNFQEGKTKFILCTTGAGGTGITLTKASIAVYLGRPWSNVDSEQSEGRVHRLGSEQHEKIIYIDYVTSGTVEETVFDALVSKSNNLQTILRDKELIRKVMVGESVND